MEGLLTKRKKEMDEIAVNKNREENGENPIVGKNPLRKVIDLCEQMVLFSILYIHSSPLQPLVGPGSECPDNYSLVHASYFAVLLFVPLSYVLAHLPGIRTYLINDANLCIFVEEKENCMDIVSELFTNRFSLAVACLFIFMSLVTMKCFATNEYTRPSLQNGFWILKLMFIFVVSLIAFSIPPTIFDSLWQYVCILGSLVQILFTSFLLLDWSNQNNSFQLHIREILPSKWKFNRWLIFTYLFIFALLIISAIGLGHVVHIFHAKRGSLPISLIVLIFPFTSIIIVHSFINLEVKLVLQCTLFLAYALLRIGLCVAYEIPYTKGLNVHLLMDTVIKLLLVAYCLFRRCQPNRYTFNGSTIYGFTSTRKTTVCDDKLMNMQQSSEAVKRNLETNMEYKNSSKEKVKTAKSEEVIKGRICESETYLNGSREVESPQKLLKMDKKKIWPTGVQLHSYSFLHVFMLTTCLDMNINTTKYKFIEEKASKFELQSSRFSLFVLNTSVVLISLAFTWSKTVKSFHANIDEYSVSEMIKTFAQSAARLFVRVMIKPPTANPLNIKILYMALASMHLVLSIAFLFPPVKSHLERSPLFCLQTTMQGRCLSTDPSLVASYQLSFTFAVFFFLMMILLVKVTTSTNPRNNIHLGFWPSKMFFIGLTFSFSFYLPKEIGGIWTHLGLAATLIVTLLQTIVILDLTNRLLDAIRAKELSASAPRKIYFSCSSIAILLYTLTITAFFCYYIYFAQFSGCKSNRIFIFINLGLCILASTISLHPAVQTGGLVQSAVMTSFCMYSTWTALYNNPREECNPMTQIIFESDVKPSKALLFAVDIIAFVATMVYITIYSKRIEDFLKQFAFICFQLKCLRVGANLEREKRFSSSSKLSFQDVLFGKSREDLPLPLLNYETNNGVQQGNYAERISMQDETGNKSGDKNQAVNKSPIPYNYSFFHLIYSLLIMHVFTLMITWTEERPGSHIIVSFHWAIMCIKMVTSSAGVVLYIWSLAVHLFASSKNGSG